jgi:hypothetical protein
MNEVNVPIESRGADKIELLLKGAPFKDGEAVQENPPPQQYLAT